MKRLNMVTYGFVRSKKDDFTDDGNTFRCYRVGNNMRVSVCTHDGEAWISARFERVDMWLRYEDYSKLEHYKDLDKLNWGVSVGAIKEQDLIDLYNDCLAYEKEYEELEKEIEPKLTLTKEDIDFFNEQIYIYSKSVYDEAKKILLDNFDSFMGSSTCYFSKAIDYTQILYRNAYGHSPNKIEVGSVEAANHLYYSRYGLDSMQETLAKIKNNLLNNNFYLREIKSCVKSQLGLNNKIYD